jgi:MoxR-like ATPase
MGAAGEWGRPPGATGAEGPAGLVGREQELALALAALAARRHLLLEGPVGCGKTTLALKACRRLGLTTVRVDGDDRFTETRLAGWFDPPLVTRMGYRRAAYCPGPLVRAMREGNVLFLNELNRLPEAAQNLLLPALDEGVVQVPHLGEVRAAAGFRVVATQNPAEYVATGHLSEALRDRFEHLGLEYQSAADEEAIVAAATGCRDEVLVRAAVRLARATRLHPCVRRGASVRGAMAIVDLAGPGRGPARLRRVAETALATRVELRDADTGLGEVLDELVDLVVTRGEDPDAAAPAAWSARADGAAPQPGAGAAGADGPEGGRRPTRPPEPEACTLEDRRALEEQLRASPEELDGWKLAGDLSTGALAHAGRRAWLCARELAAGAVLRRAGRLVGPLRAATRTGREPLLEPWSGEFDVEATMENLLGKPHPEQGDLIVRRRVDRRHQVVLMVDTSLSMAGEKMALAAVATAVLALKLRPGDLAVELFADGARLISRFDEEVPPAELVRRMLAVPCGGGTDIGAALRLGHAELQRGRDPGRSGLLVTDGMYTSGADPLPAAARFGLLHVLLMEAQPTARQGGPGGAAGSAAPSSATLGLAATGRPLVTTWISPRLHVGEAIARAAGGGLVRVDGFPALPRRMLQVADRVLR